jgi:hypothetical protein
MISRLECCVVILNEACYPSNTAHFNGLGFIALL